MNNNWKECFWGDIATLEYGKSLRNYRDNKGLFPVYGTNGLIGSNDTALCDHPGVIVGRKGAYRGIHYSSKPFYVIDTAFYLKPKNKDLDLLFAYYELLTHDINSMDSGSAIPSTSREDFYNLPLRLPPIHEQKTIASFLNNFDKKIEINQKMNKTLEEIGQAIFKHWFVHFEFPNEEGKPYRSCDGEMVDSELGEIPKGWKVFTLGDLCSSISETYKLKNKDGIFFLNTGDLFDGKVINHQFSDVESLPGQAKKKIRKNDILYSEIRPANRRFAFVDFDAEEYVVSTKLMVLRANDNITPELLFQFLKIPSIIEYFQGLAESRSGTFPQITFDTIKHIQIPIPTDRNAMENFGVIFSSILKITNQNIAQNKSLSQIRNLLLPKLMSGKIRVNGDKNEILS